MKLILLFLFLPLTANARLSVTASPPKIVGRKAVIKFTIRNNLIDEVKEARAACFLLDGEGKMVGQSTKWVIGQNKIGLAPKAEAKFNFVITTPRATVTSNLTAKVIFSRIILEGGKVVDLRQGVQIVAASENEGPKQK